MNTTDMTLSIAVDTLGALLAQIASLTKQAEAIKGELKAAGVGATDGALFRATVIEQERTTVDWKAIAEKLEPSRQLVTAHTETKAVQMVKVTSL